MQTIRVPLWIWWCDHNKTTHSETTCIFHVVSNVPLKICTYFYSVFYCWLSLCYESILDTCNPFTHHSTVQCVHIAWCSYICHYDDVIRDAMASQITSLTIVYSTVYSGADQRKHQSSASLAFVRGIRRGPVKSPHKWSVTRKMFPFDDVIMIMYMLKEGPSWLPLTVSLLYDVVIYSIIELHEWHAYTTGSVWSGISQHTCTDHMHRLRHWGRDKMAAFSKWHLEMHFLEWRYMNFD